jgi:hypothetical protein
VTGNATVFTPIGTSSCRLRAKATFPLLAGLIHDFFTGSDPDPAWI